ncbi:unnamed protein product, partial [Brachionus calyciflorus]
MSQQRKKTFKKTIRRTAIVGQSSNGSYFRREVQEEVEYIEPEIEYRHSIVQVKPKTVKRLKNLEHFSVTKKVIVCNCTGKCATNRCKCLDNHQKCTNECNGCVMIKAGGGGGGGGPTGGGGGIGIGAERTGDGQ